MNAQLKLQFDYEYELSIIFIKIEKTLRSNISGNIVPEIVNILDNAVFSNGTRLSKEDKLHIVLKLKTKFEIEKIANFGVNNTTLIDRIKEIEKIINNGKN